MNTSRDHVLKIAPTFLLVFRSLQLATAVAILGLAAYGENYYSFDGDGLMLFTAIATIIITVYIIVSSTATPVAYNYWAILGLDIFAVIFWIVAFALLASEVAPFNAVTYPSVTTPNCIYYVYGFCVRNKRGLGLAKRIFSLGTYRNALAAAAGLGGLEFGLFVTTLVFTSIGLHKHRKASGHCMPNSDVGKTQAEPHEAGQPTEPPEPLFASV
ncbi:hypothetical protein OIDMADRAFT_62057 [Oidiodendron maius Zn]|uniref:MARVEL domain-containing protein n=1 Tax=Oidiodendron maius (strain Zn) TaxID=913774 RepID=A0A0C3C236_OIDMZ|nr:hypothetical protein OIDMADRAFT_62057 [Oidiodendron maius Zn]